MRGHSLRSWNRSITAVRLALVKPAHISGLGLGLCLILALATPPAGLHRANATRIAMPQSANSTAAARNEIWAKSVQGEKLGNLDLSQIVAALGDSQRLVGYLADMGYRLDTLRDGVGTVPRLYLASLPNDLPQVESAEIRKTVFIKSILPAILRTNEEILDRRARLEALSRKQESGRELSASEQVWLAETAALYDLKTLNLPELLRRVDVVPPSLALAQGALESGWGTSRFAQNGNALFGQKIFIESNEAIPSYDRNGKEVFRMRSFDDVQSSVRSYVHNLNSHPAYAGFRKLRAEMRKKTAPGRNDFGPQAADALAKTLLRYSERGADYIADVRQLMQVNDLRAFDRAQLASSQASSTRRGV